MNVLSPNFWTDAKVRELGVTGKLLFAAIITDDRVNLPGLYAAGPEHFYRAMLPAPVEEVQSAFKRILEAGIAQFDPGHGVLRLPNVWKHAPAPNPNQVGSWKSAWLKIPDCSLRYAHLTTLRDLAYKGNDAARAAYDAMFGQIQEGKHVTYVIGRDYLKNMAKARREAGLAGTRDPAVNSPNNNKMDFILLGSGEGDPAEPGAQAGRSGDLRTKTATKTKTTTTTKTEGSRTLLEPFSNPSDRVSEPFSNPSRTLLEPLPQVTDIPQQGRRLSLVNLPASGVQRYDLDSDEVGSDSEPAYQVEEVDQ